MRIGVVKEIKPLEQRVGLTPAMASTLVRSGHEVLVEQAAGEGAGFGDEQYTAAGARIVADVDEVWAASELLVKVKEPIAEEYGRLHADLVLFCYLHLAPDPALTTALLEAGTTAIAYETVEAPGGGLPLLAPMSEIAGRLAGQAAAQHLLAPFGGPGRLIGGAPGVAPARVVVIGGGVAGSHAARVASGMGADVVILERSGARLRQLDELFDGRATVLMSSHAAIEEELGRADAVIGAVLVAGALAPKLVTRDMLGLLPDRAVLVDVAIDQGGCFETSHPTTYEAPVFEVEGVTHYCVANMPGAVPVTATRALTNATAPYIEQLANLGLDDALAAEPGLAQGVNVRAGEIVYAPVAEAFALQAVA
jgi:alanine dehydrogenase